MAFRFRNGSYYLMPRRIIVWLILITTVTPSQAFRLKLESRRSARPPTIPSYHHHPALFAQRLIRRFEPTDFPTKCTDWPYTDADLSRADPSPDELFYSKSRLVTHIDDRAIASLTEFYREEFTAYNQASSRKGAGNDAAAPIDVLDLCSSWISHLPQQQQQDDDKTMIQYGNVIGVGMNEKELQANQQLTDHYVQDLNLHPQLKQFQNESFDVVCNVVSVDYLTKPKEIFQEIHRVLRPDGLALISFSNRCFPTKIISMWRNADDIGRMMIVGSYFHYSDRPWKTVLGLDIIPPPPPNAKTAEANNKRDENEKTVKKRLKKLLRIIKRPIASLFPERKPDPLFVVKAIK